MKIAACISSYSPDPAVLELVATPLRRIADVSIFSPVDVSKHGKWIECGKSLGHHLVYEPRKWMKQHQAEYDVFYYSEDDVMINGDQLLYAIEHKTGFIRLELDNGYIDLNPCHSIHTGGNGRTDIVRWIKDGYWQPFNLHSGNFIADAKKVDMLASTFAEEKKPYCGVLESGATTPYYQIEKRIPIDFAIATAIHLKPRYSGPTADQLRQTLEAAQMLW